MAGMSKGAQALGLIGWLVLCFLAAAIGSVGSMEAPSFYGQLQQPEWAPPPSVFGPVWTLLYTMMAIAAWLVWRQGGFKANGLALGVFLVQLALNALWSWTFFAWQLGALSLVNIVALLVLIVVTIVLFGRVQRWAAAVLAPYLLWVGFATALNFTLWRMNPGILGG